MSRGQDAASSPHLGGKAAVVLFAFTLLAFVTETQLSQYVQTTLGFRQPFFLFYIVHSSFTFIFPVHALILTVTHKCTFRQLLDSLSAVVTMHISSNESQPSRRFPLYRFMRLIIGLTIGITYPGLLWFAAITLTSIGDVTAIWSTNAFFAYVIAVKTFGLKWEPRRMMAVVLATLGTLAVVYGGSTSSNAETAIKSSGSQITPTAPLFGDLLTLIGSVGYGLYQVLYKKYAALPSDSEIASDGLYTPIAASEEEADVTQEPVSRDLVVNPPFGLHSNMLTSAIGLLTLALLWIPIPVLHYLDLEKFSFPLNAATWWVIAGIALSGVLFNAGFMILLGVWGPITTSVGNLLTIVLVFFSDVIFGNGAEVVTIWSLIGSGVIIAAFGVLAYDMSAGERRTQQQ